MAISEVRQRARKGAAERVARLRQQRAGVIHQREVLSAEVMTALAERDALVADAERRAGAALHALVASGLSLAEASVWCDLTARDAARLMKPAAASSQPGASASGPAQAS